MLLSTAPVASATPPGEAPGPIRGAAEPELCLTQVSEESSLVGRRPCARAGAAWHLRPATGSAATFITSADGTRCLTHPGERAAVPGDPLVTAPCAEGVGSPAWRDQRWLVSPMAGGHVEVRQVVSELCLATGPRKSVTLDRCRADITQAWTVGQ